MRVVVTGSKGFTGHHLMSLLAKKAFDALPLTSDLTDAQAVLDEMQHLKPEVVIHLAGLTYVPTADDIETYRVNSIGSDNLLKACKAQAKTIKKVILGSSSNVYGRTAGLLDEATPPAPINHYGCSKLAMEFIAKTYQDFFEVVITRPFNYTGVGQGIQFLLAKIVDHFARQAPVIHLGNTEIARDFSDVRWIAEAYVHLAQNTDARGIYNLCSSQATSIRNIIEILSTLTGHNIDIVVDQNLVRSNDIAYQVGSNKRLCSTFNIPPIPLTQTFEWMLEHHR
ncbi:MAG: NAD-dependent epimerase/dehydratase family protein [Holosporales bacterium]